LFFFFPASSSFLFKDDAAAIAADARAPNAPDDELMSVGVVSVEGGRSDPAAASLSLPILPPADLRPTSDGIFVVVAC
jgi:hypothetical protein